VIERRDDGENNRRLSSDARRIRRLSGIAERQARNGLGNFIMADTAKNLLVALTLSNTIRYNKQQAMHKVFTLKSKP
jgi:hypothetical protein